MLLLHREVSLRSPRNRRSDGLGLVWPSPERLLKSFGVNFIGPVVAGSGPDPWLLFGSPEWDVARRISFSVETLASSRFKRSLVSCKSLDFCWSSLSFCSSSRTCFSFARGRRVG